MPLSDPDLLDVVRRLRQYMSSLDNTQAVLESLSNIDDKQVVDATFTLIPRIVNITDDISSTLKIVEGSRQYREMAKKFNLEDEDDN